MRVRVKPLQMKRITARMVVSAVGRANGFIANFVRKSKRIRVQISMEAKGKGEVTYALSGDRLQVVARANHFILQTPAIAHTAEIGVTPRVGADLDASSRQSTNLLWRIDWQRRPGQHIMRKGLLVHYKTRRDEVGAGYSLFHKERQGMVAVLRVAVVERQGYSGSRRVARSNSPLSFLKRNQLHMLHEPLDLPLKLAI
jgi:hypothetical protein